MRQAVTMCGFLEAPGPPITHVSAILRLFIVSVSLVLLILLQAIVVHGNPYRLLIGKHKRYSESKGQMALWFVTVMASYIGTVALRAYKLGLGFIGGVNVPANLLLLVGVSTLFFVAAKAITTARVRAASSPGPTKFVPEQVPRRFLLVPVALLIGTDYLVGLGVVAYLGQVYDSLADITASKTVSLPEVDSATFFTFVLGHVASLARRLSDWPPES